MSLHPNFRLYLNNLLGRSQIYERREFTDQLVSLIAPHFSAEGWNELLKLADAKTAVLYPPDKPKPMTEAQNYRITLLPAKQRDGVRQVGA